MKRPKGSSKAAFPYPGTQQEGAPWETAAWAKRATSQPMGKECGELEPVSA